MRILIIILAVISGAIIGGLIGFFGPLLIFTTAAQEAPGGPASAGWVLAILTIPACAIAGGTPTVGALGDIWNSCS